MFTSDPGPLTESERKWEMNENKLKSAIYKRIKAFLRKFQYETYYKVTEKYF